MKKNFRNKDAEDILGEDFLFEEILLEDQSNVIFDSNELDLAKKIHREICNRRNTLSPIHKKQLGNRIDRSIKEYRRKKIIIRYSIAASILVLVGIGILFQTNKDPNIRAFAENNQMITSNGNTRLILSKEQEIQIISDESKIAYTGNGHEIAIDSAQNVIQNVESNELVFNSVVVPYGKRTQITLSDNSKIWLNSGSKLIYPAKFAKEKREVYLEGEAIFEVSHNQNHPFYVVTRDLEVKVLGTVFNVSAYNDDVTTKTTLVNGSIELDYKSNFFLSQSKVVMVPGMLAVYDPSSKSVEQVKVNTQHYTSWKDGYFVFESQSLGSILKKISRYYNVTIQLDDPKLENETFSGYLDLRKTAYQVMEVIAEIINVKVENIDNHIIITKL